MQVKRLLGVIKACTQKTPETVDRAVLRRAAHSLAELSKSGKHMSPSSSTRKFNQPHHMCTLCKQMFAAEENVDTVVAEGGISHIVPLLSFFPAPSADSKDRRFVHQQSQ